MADNFEDYFGKNETAYEEMLKTMQEKSFLERMKMMFEGFTKPRDSGEYKLAKQQLELMTAPIIAFVTVSVLVLAMFLIAPGKDAAERAHVAEVVQPQAVEDMDEPPPAEEIEPPEPMEFEAEFADVAVNNVAVNAPVNAPMSAKPAAVNAVAPIVSPIQMKGIYGNRSTGQIGESRKKFGGSAEVEQCVIRSLRWLASVQNGDGSWGGGGKGGGGPKPAMTGMALLTFLAHGETPGSAEFGNCVRKSIEYLIGSQDAETGIFKGHDGNNYSHPIATYAMCEAYSMTRNPMAKECAEKALVPIVQGQYKSGTWAYKMKGPEVNVGYPNGDMSYAGWCAQAVKAGHMAGDLNVAGLDEAFRKAPDGLKLLGHPEGGFGYNSKSHTRGLTAVGTLCMQLMGRGNDDAVKKSLKVMDDWVLGWTQKTNKLGQGTGGIKDIGKPKLGDGGNPQYYAYYATQAMFQAGGDRWTKWNKAMSAIYPKVQIVATKETSGYRDHKGQPQETGRYEPNDHYFYPVMATSLACLQMEVYYRYLPTFKEVKVEDAEVVLSDVATDVGVEIEF